MGKNKNVFPKVAVLPWQKDKSRGVTIKLISQDLLSKLFKFKPQSAIFSILALFLKGLVTLTPFKCRKIGFPRTNSNCSQAIIVLILAFLISSCVPIPVFANSQLTASYYTVQSCKKEGTSGITSSGEVLDDNLCTAASWDYPFNTYLRITNVHNKKSVIVKVNDRGPAKRLYKKGRIIDLSYKAMCELDGIKSGIIPIKVELIKTKMDLNK